MRFRIFYRRGELTGSDSKDQRRDSALEFIEAIWENEHRIVNKYGDHDWTIVIYNGTYHVNPSHITAYGFREDGAYLQQVFSLHLNVSGNLQDWAGASRRVREVDLDLVKLI
ncbi:hypothetical protein GALMADRAFT_144296 [Galerina marginata CBS 339.88]|uniref:Uncharacterized protein n=1 Tax=Galerina marginata (strain CBS 339.88) TaxID=685588 RepID=A0A067SL91_GALM3|nr:hypothetical protein GALMADRAFT_144296 [Galerina marginata CBS 339.88]